MRLVRVLRVVDAINDWVGRGLSLFIYGMFVLTMMEVIRRYFFNAPTVWGNELTQMLFGTYAIMCGGYLLRWGGHVNVDIVYAKLKPRTKAVIDSFTFVLFFLFCGMMFYYGGSLALESLTTLEHSQSAWNPPIYPVKLMIPLGSLLLGLQGIAKLIRDVYFAFTGRPLDPSLVQAEE